MTPKEEAEEEYDDVEEDDDDEDDEESSRSSFSQQQQQQQQQAASDQGAGLDDGDSGTTAFVVMFTPYRYCYYVCQCGRVACHPCAAESCGRRR